MSIIQAAIFQTKSKEYLSPNIKPGSTFGKKGIVKNIHFLTDILIDMTNRNRRYKTGLCHYCNSDIFPHGKIVDPSDKYARHTGKGDWKCGTCVNEESKKLLNMMNRRKGNPYSS